MIVMATREVIAPEMSPTPIPAAAPSIGRGTPTVLPKRGRRGRTAAVRRCRPDTTHPRSSASGFHTRHSKDSQLPLYRRSAYPGQRVGEQANSQASGRWPRSAAIECVYRTGCSDAKQRSRSAPVNTPASGATGWRTHASQAGAFRSAFTQIAVQFEDSPRLSEHRG